MRTLSATVGTSRSRPRVRPSAARAAGRRSTARPAHQRRRARVASNRRENGAQIATYTSYPAMDASGNLIAFATDAALRPADANTSVDVYLRDLVAHTTTHLASRRNGAALGDSADPSISADGTRVASAPARRCSCPAARSTSTSVTGRRDDGDRRSGGRPERRGRDRRASTPRLSGDGDSWCSAAPPRTSRPTTRPGRPTLPARPGRRTTRLLSRRSGLAGAKLTSSVYDPAISSDARPSHSRPPTSRPRRGPALGRFSRGRRAEHRDRGEHARQPNAGGAPANRMRSRPA